MAEQLALEFPRGLPLPVSALAARRFAMRALRACPETAARAGFRLRAHLETVATLDQFQRGCRSQARELKRRARAAGERMGGRALIAYVCTPEGRRAQAWIDRLARRLADEETELLCG